MVVRQSQGMSAAVSREDRAAGFPPIAGRTPRVLILGTLPSVASIKKHEYYGHPQNAFWKIMFALLGDREDGDTRVVEAAYAERTGMLERAGIAVWDVLGRSVRPGSMDADIDLATAEANPLAGFLESHPSIALVGFNGRKARDLYERFVDTSAVTRGIDYALLPSTSPAYAAMPLAEKAARWRDVLEPHIDTVRQ